MPVAVFGEGNRRSARCRGLGSEVPVMPSSGTRLDVYVDDAAASHLRC